MKTTVVINIHLCALQKVTSLASIFNLTGKWETIIKTKKKLLELILKPSQIIQYNHTPYIFTILMRNHVNFCNQ